MSWEKVRWRDVLNIYNGKNQSKVVNPNGRYPIYGSGGLMGYSDDFLCPAETTIIGRKGSINNPIFVNTEFWNVDTAFGLVAKEGLLPKYLYYFCKTFNFLKLDKSTTLPSLTKSDLLEIEMSLPPLPIQEKISAILDKADALRRKDQELLKKYDELAHAIFIDMFGDPVRNEKGWEVKKLGELGKLDRGVSKHRPRNAPDLLGGPYPLIQTGDVANSGGWIKYYRSTYSETGLKQSKIWKEGTLCITIAANIAKTGILTFDACFPDSIVGFSSNEYSNEVFIQYWFSFFQKLLEDQAPESAQKNINLGILRDLNVISPPVYLQDAFAKKIELINQLKAQANAEKSEKLFQSLLQRAFKDELITEVDNL